MYSIFRTDFVLFYSFPYYWRYFYGTTCIGSSYRLCFILHLYSKFNKTHILELERILYLQRINYFFKINLSIPRGDWLLKFLYRTLSIAVHGVAGLQPIELNDRRMQNVDLTDLVLGNYLLFLKVICVCIYIFCLSNVDQFQKC